MGHPARGVIESGHVQHEECREPLRLGGRRGRAGHRALPDRGRLRLGAVGIGQAGEAVVGGTAARGGEGGVSAFEGGEQAGERVGSDAGGVRKSSGPGLHAAGLVHLERGVGSEGRHDTGRAAGCRDGVVPLEAVGRVVGGADQFHVHPRQDAAGGEVAVGQLPIGLDPDGLGRRGVQQVLDPKMPPQFQVGPVEERVAERVGNGLGPGLEFVTRRGGARDQVLGDAVGPHGPPLVVVAVEPDSVQVFEPPVLGDVARAEVAVVVDNRLRGRDPMVEVGGNRVGEQEGVVAECHGCRVSPGVGGVPRRAVS